jgi:hypothetical protein
MCLRKEQRKSMKANCRIKKNEIHRFAQSMRQRWGDQTSDKVGIFVLAENPSGMLG